MYKTIVGLEIHIELRTKSKMFCSCKNDPDERHPNVNICPICLGHPGTLPVINKEAVRKVIKTGLALNCDINYNSKFDRKNYFYPDLPKGYQISQYDLPLCKDGFLQIDDKKIRIERIHLEEDTARLIHPVRDYKDREGPQSSQISNGVHSEGTDYSLIDFNRAGVPLMELVTRPDITSAKEARRFAEELRLIARYLDVSDADMEKGQMRVEVNISLMKDEKSKIQKLGTKVEIKNLNSFRAVEKAIEYEIKRQSEILNRGEKVIQETRGWDAKREITVSQRIKEEAYDYRYFPEPDLPPLSLDKKYIQDIRAELPEMPQQKRVRLKEEYNLSDEEIEIFVQNKDLGEYFEKAVSELRNWIKDKELKESVTRTEFLKLSKLCANYITTDLQSLLKEKSVQGEDFLITPENFAEFITLIYTGEISSKIAKTVLGEMFSTGEDPSHIIEEKGLSQITKEDEIEKVVKKIISENPKPVEDFKKGKQNALQYLIGQAMKETKGKANPQMLKEVLAKLLK